MSKKLVLNWNEISHYIDMLAEKIKNSDIEYSNITGIPRGGLIPAIMLSHKLDIPYIELEKTYQFYYPTSKVLIVDDICDSGVTMKRYHDYTTCALVKRYNSKFTPNFYCDKINSDEWIIFPWEKYEADTIQGYLVK